MRFMALRSGPCYFYTSSKSSSAGPSLLASPAAASAVVCLAERARSSICFSSCSSSCGGRYKTTSRQGHLA